MRVKQVKGREMTAGLTMAAALLTGLITVPSLLFQAGMDFTAAFMSMGAVSILASAWLAYRGLPLLALPSVPLAAWLAYVVIISKGGSWRIEAKLLKTGAADVLVKYYDSEDREDTQTEKYRIVAFKYENPFKSLKIGKKNFASKFKKGFVYDKVKAKTKGKLSFSLKKNWKAEIISTYNNTKEESWRQLKKGSKLNIAKRDEIAFNLVNKKTGARVLFILGCKSGEKPLYKFTWGSN